MLFTRFTSAIIGNSVKSIGSTAFGQCSGLSSIICLNPTPPSIARGGAIDDGFGYAITNTCVLKVPSGSVTLYQQVQEVVEFYS